MGVDQLLAALERDAAAEAASRIEAARREAEAIATETALRLTRLGAGRLQDHEAQERAAAEARLAAARREARAVVLEARARFLARVLEAARARLGGVLDGPDGEGVLSALLAKALDHTGEADAVIRCAGPLVPRVRAAAGGRARLAVETGSEAGAGVRVHAAEGSVAIDATLEALLARETPSLAIEILRRFEEAR